ncbi:hypothetical protein MNBD_GAMMA06-2088 [hydrothermal vent metagenome]|uniref:Glyoxalase/fosfomycin resistance/dioxygenase domain-containing protein n=1 Tax=hydrothermal vent metagenome TaxID=652676 RepID=A0A3B0WMQ6_9ZZZZ
MAILSSIPVLNCQSIEDTLAFYQQLLQFVVVNKREENGKLCWVHIMHSDTTLMLQSDRSQNTHSIPATKSNIALYFFVNNIAELHHLIKAKNNKISEIKNTDYQTQEFSLIDPEGNPVTLGMTMNSKS